MLDSSTLSSSATWSKRYSKQTRRFDLSLQQFNRCSVPMKTRSLTYSLLTQTTTSFVRASPPARCSVKCRLLNNSNHRCSNSNHSNRRYNPSHSLALRLHSRYNRRITFSCNLNRVFYPLNSPFKFSMLRRLPCRKLHYHLRPPYPLLCSKAISQ